MKNSKISIYIRKHFFSRQITKKCLSTLSKEDLFILRHGVQKSYNFLQTSKNIKETLENCSGLCSYLNTVYDINFQMASIEYYTFKWYLQLEAPYRINKGYFWAPYKWKPRKRYLKMLLEELDLILDNYGKGDTNEKKSSIK